MQQRLVNEENVDSAFNIAKTMDSSVTLHFMLSDVCNAYLKLRTEEGCRKAYKVAQYKEKQRADVRKLFNSIIETCIQLKSQKSIILAEEIYEDNSKCLALSSHKNDFHMAKAQLEYKHKTEIEEEKNKLKELSLSSARCEKTHRYESHIEDILCQRGDLSAIFGRQVKKLAHEGEFQEALRLAHNIPNDIEQKGSINDISEACFLKGDPAALEFALEIAKGCTEFKDNYLFGYIDSCKNLGDKKLGKEMALKAADEMSSNFKFKQQQKIEREFR